MLSARCPGLTALLINVAVAAILCAKCVSEKQKSYGGNIISAAERPGRVPRRMLELVTNHPKRLCSQNISLGSSPQADFPHTTNVVFTGVNCRSSCDIPV